MFFLLFIIIIKLSKFNDVAYLGALGMFIFIMFHFFLRNILYNYLIRNKILSIKFSFINSLV